MRHILLTLAAGLLAVSAYAANVKSGLEPGKRVGAFGVVDVSGPNKGTQFCYRCKFGNAPVVAAFIKSGAKKTGEVVAQFPARKNPADADVAEVIERELAAK